MPSATWANETKGKNADYADEEKSEGGHSKVIVEPGTGSPAPGQYADGQQADPEKPIPSAQFVPDCHQSCRCISGRHDRRGYWGGNRRPTPARSRVLFLVENQNGGMDFAVSPRDLGRQRQQLPATRNRTSRRTHFFSRLHQGRFHRVVVDPFQRQRIEVR